MKAPHAVLLCGIACLLAIATKPCAAQTAEEMLSACRPITQSKISNGMIDLPSDFDSGTCWGAFGMLDATVHLLNENQRPSLHACVPSDTTRTELNAIFVKHIEEHPEEYGKSFPMIAINSILNVYPCGKRKG